MFVQVYWGWVFSAVTESIVVFSAVYFGMRFPDSDGATMYVFQFGSVCFSCIVSLVTLRICVEAQQHTLLFRMLAMISVAIWVPSAFIFDAGDADRIQGGMGRIFASASFWVTLVLVLVAGSVRVVFAKMWNRHFRTEFRHAVQEYELVAHNADVANEYVARAPWRRCSTVFMQPDEVEFVEDSGAPGETGGNGSEWRHTAP